MRNHKKAGFTLIELLVVIAIIGVLSSIVLSSLSESRKRAADAGIKVDLSHLRSSAEIVYHNLSGTYNNTGAAIYSATCGATLAANPATHVFNDGEVQRMVDDAVSKSGTDAKCVSGSNFYVLAVQLKSDSTKAWCVDNAGASKAISWATFTGVGDTNCTLAGS